MATKPRVISSVAELPREFDLSKYRASEKFGLADWAANFNFRALRRSTYSTFLELDRKKEGSPTKEYLDNELPRTLAYIWESPLVPEDVARVYCAESMSKHLSTRQVRDQSTLEGLAGYWEFGEGDKRMKKYTEAMIRSNEDNAQDDDHKLLWETPMWKAFQECGIGDNGDVSAVVNLHAPEDVLVAHFRDWLRTIKAERGLDLPRKAVSQTDLDDWSRYCLLPYIDLSFWAEANGFEITQQAMGSALFPNEYNVNLAERVRKTVAPMARRAVTYDFCDYLVTQVLGLPPEKLWLLPDSEKNSATKPGTSRVEKLFPDYSGDT